MFLISRRNAVTVLDPIEEPPDLSSMEVEERAEADRITAILASWDVRPASTRTHERSNLGYVLSFVGKYHSTNR